MSISYSIGSPPSKVQSGPGPSSVHKIANNLLLLLSRPTHKPGDNFDKTGTFGHASFFLQEFERREEVGQSRETNPVARPDFEKQILWQLCRSMACKYCYKLACWNVAELLED